MTLRREEGIVGTLVGLILPGSRMEYVVSQSCGEWDFNLHVGTEVFPFEVTRSTSEQHQQTYARILDGERGQGPFFIKK